MGCNPFSRYIKKYLYQFTESNTLSSDPNLGLKLSRNENGGENKILIEDPQTKFTKQYCHNCGIKILSSDIFCPNCGVNLLD